MGKYNKSKNKEGKSAVIHRKKAPQQKEKDDVDDGTDDDFEVTQAESIDKSSSNAATVSDSDGEDVDTRQLVKKQNRKKKKSGGFQSMGFSHGVYKGIIRKGYKVPTPIQRKTIPIIMDGRDVVAMARTGSGKTAAFLLPMFEKLQTHGTKGARGIVLSPTRELALQTMKFAKELGKYTSLKFTLILGGDKLEDQFASMHENPDVVIATPGRFLHLLVEMNMKLSHAEYVVFDEADRLFEMGFAEQLREILHRLPEFRQTLLFSATLPKNLIEFTKAGLNDPTLIRLDVESKLSEQLKMSFFSLRADDKAAMLLHLLNDVIKPNQQCVIFTATKHHVEYLKELLQKIGIECSYIYSSLDATARKINVAKFQKKLCQLLVVTDIAARGIDIPMLDAVINYDFPAKPKLFVHRVGRVARAGRSGVAYSLVAADEIAYLLDLHLFLGRPLKLPSAQSKPGDDGVFGGVPQRCIDDQEDALREMHASSYDLCSMRKVVENACKQYIKSRPLPSQESVKRSKELATVGFSLHPSFGESNQDNELIRGQLLNNLKHFKPGQTIFEVRNNKKSTGSAAIMKQKRDLHCATIERNKQKTDALRSTLSVRDEKTVEPDNGGIVIRDPAVDQGYKDEEFYVPRKSANAHDELGLSVNSYEKDANLASMDIVGDDERVMKRHTAAKKWDRKRKKFVSIDDGGKNKKIRSESGQWIPASYKTNIYKDWVEKNRMNDGVGQEDEQDGVDGNRSWPSNSRRGKVASKRGGSSKSRGRGPRDELKSKDQILKTRLKKQSIQSRLKSNQRGNSRRHQQTKSKRK